LASAANAKFDKARTALRIELDVQMTAHVPSASDKRGWPRPREWLVTIAYEVVCALLDNDQLAVLDRYKVRLYRVGMPPTVNAFQLGLFVLFGHDEAALSETMRSPIGKKMWIAYRHYVPAPLLVSFIRDLSNVEMDELNKPLALRQDMLSWIIDQRARLGTVDGRGQYPDRIEDAAKRRASVLDDVTFHREKYVRIEDLLEMLNFVQSLPEGQAEKAGRVLGLSEDSLRGSPAQIIKRLRRKR
jgi:hypothetical protein